MNTSQNNLYNIDAGFRHDPIWLLLPDKSLDQFPEKVELTLEQWSNKAGYETEKFLRSLKLKADQWWYFLAHPEIPPDYNLAYPSLRLAITKRKVGGGNRSMERFQHTVNKLAVVQTCCRQRRSVIDFLEQSKASDRLSPSQLIRAFCYSYISYLNPYFF